MSRSEPAVRFQTPVVLKTSGFALCVSCVFHARPLSEFRSGRGGEKMVQCGRSCVIFDAMSIRGSMSLPTITSVLLCSGAVQG